MRVAIQALAAVCGGTQSLHTNGQDEALGLPTEDSVRVALRTQQVIAHESGITEFSDPLGGAWALEELTDSIVAGAREYIARIDEMGGAATAIERGYQQQEIADAAYDHTTRCRDRRAHHCWCELVPDGRRPTARSSRDRPQRRARPGEEAARDSPQPVTELERT